MAYVHRATMPKFACLIPVLRLQKLVGVIKRDNDWFIFLFPKSTPFPTLFYQNALNDNYICPCQPCLYFRVMFKPAVNKKHSGIVPCTNKGLYSHLARPMAGVIFTSRIAKYFDNIHSHLPASISSRRILS